MPCVTSHPNLGFPLLPEAFVTAYHVLTQMVDGSLQRSCHHCTGIPSGSDEL